jgi:phenylalanyl-tRNA synthetase beta chain
MKASYFWLRALLPKLKASHLEVAERFAGAGIAVDAITEYGAGTAPIVVAEVRAVEPHPSRPKLRLVTVDHGGGEQRVVCGAPNVPEPGGLVALARVGTTLPAIGLTLTPREIGGVASEGMLCSEMELGLVAAGKRDDDPGILVLPAGAAKAGAPLRKAVPAVHDFILELDLTPNRPDALGHIGLARDLAVLFDVPFDPPAPDAPARIAEGSLQKLVGVDIEDTERCPHYGAAAVVDVKVGPSPAWLRYRLESLGVRSISNVVDVTNLVMLEFGHPMHAFDLDLVRGGRIVVRRAREGEVLATLDGVERRLSPDDLVIADGEGPVALGGVMGGAGSEIRDATKRVLLECAYFTSRGIRRSSRRHGLHTDSSHRFERGVDPADVPDALAHAASLLTHLAGGAGVPGTIVAGVELSTPKPITLRAKRLDALLGTHVPFAEAIRVLSGLGFRVSGSQASPGEETAEVVAPTFRPDVHAEADLVDEIMRIRGMGAIPTTLPAIRPQPPRGTGAIEAAARAAAIEIGLSEALAFSFVSQKQIAALGLPPAAVALKNPLSEERSVMRTSLLPGLLDAVGRARRHGVADVRLFQVGARFLEASEAAGPDSALPCEALSFAAVIAGHRRAVLEKPKEVDVYDAKGVAVEIASRITNRKVTVAHQPIERRAPYLHPRGAGDVIIDGRVVGCFGPIHPDVADLSDLSGPVVLVELDLEQLGAMGKLLPKARPIPVLPAATRDIALVVHDDVSAGSVAELIQETAGELCESVELFDLFRGESIPVDHRSLAYHVIYRDPKAASDPEKAKTLTDEEVDQRHQAVVKALSSRFGAALRA